MSGLLEVIDPGLGNAIQDAGRSGYRAMGVAVSGWLDAVFAWCANALAGNAPDAACIEVRGAGPTLVAREGRIRVAVVGSVPVEWRRADGREGSVPAWASVLLEPGDEIRVGPVRGGIAYVAVSGGIRTPLQLGSRSTYQRAGIGGIDGRLLDAGDLLPCGIAADGDPGDLQAAPWRHGNEPIRVLLGPQQGHFTAAAIAVFLSAEFKVTPQRDRMGMRLEGPVLEHVAPAAADIVSDGVTPGAIQVPGNGQPIVLLADCQTVGGYPKLATVIAADLPRLAQLDSGATVRFRAVDAAAARAALLEREDRWQEWKHGIRRPLPPPADDDDFGNWCAPI